MPNENNSHIAIHIAIYATIEINIETIVVIEIAIVRLILIEILPTVSLKSEEGNSYFEFLFNKQYHYFHFCMIQEI